MLFDGDFGIQLFLHLKPAERLQPLPELQALKTNRFAVYRAHLDFLRAGAQIIRTNTCRASVQYLTEHMHISASESLHLITTAVHLANKAVYKYYEENDGDTSNAEEYRLRRALVAGSCGSYALAHLDSNDYPTLWKYMSTEKLMIWHRSRIQTLLNAGVDLLAFESIPCAKEAEALIELLREFPIARAWITFLCSDGIELEDGNDFKDVAIRCYHALPEQIVAIGVHCNKPSLGTFAMKRINDYKYSYGDIPLVVCSDKYFECDDDTDEIYDVDPIAVHVCEWLPMGVRFIGGANLVGVEEIENISEEMKHAALSSKL